VFAAEISGVERFERRSDGTLASKASLPAPSGSLPYGVAISPDAQNVYVTDVLSTGGDGLWQLGFDPSGELEALTPFYAGTRPGPTAIAIATPPTPVPSPIPAAPPPSSSGASIAATGPTANAVAVRGKRTKRGESFAFDATLSVDPGGKLVSYRWTLDGRVVALTPRFSRFFSSGRRSYRLTLTVLDDKGLSASTVVAVSPQARRAPVLHVVIPAAATFCLDCTHPSSAAATLLRGLRRYARGAHLVSISSYADATGSRAYNLNLTRRRSHAIAHLLLSGLVPAPRRIALSWHGESDPIASNATDAGRARNRRSVIRIVR
jgi:hypothetical protein